MTVPTADELMDQRRQARLRQIYDALILATTGVVPEVTMVAEFKIPPTLISSKFKDDERLVVTKVKVAMTRWPIVTDEEDADGWIEVHGYSYRAKINGEMDVRSRPSWYPLPEELAPPLLLAAMTRAPVVKPVTVEEAK